jgi:hypothetical protein
MIGDDIAQKHLDMAETLLEVLEETPNRGKKIIILADIMRFMIEGGNRAIINGIKISTDNAMDALKQYKIIEKL